jgi:hypothetical protein
MDWNKAGCPRTSLETDDQKKEQETSVSEQKTEFWTDEEASIIAACNSKPMMMLALAVIKQWVLDGRPSCDAESIKSWVQVIKDNI